MAEVLRRAVEHRRGLDAGRPCHPDGVDRNRERRQSLAERQNRDVRRARQSSRVRRTRLGWCAWDALGAVRLQGIGPQPEGDRQQSAEDSRRRVRWMVCGRKSASRAECQRLGPGFPCRGLRQRLRAQWEPCTPGVAQFEALLRAGLEARWWGTPCAYDLQSGDEPVAEQARRKPQPQFRSWELTSASPVRQWGLQKQECLERKALQPWRGAAQPVKAIPQPSQSMRLAPLRGVEPQP